MVHGGTQEALGCLALTKAGARCKNRAQTGQTYRGRHAGPLDAVEERPDLAETVDSGKPQGEWLVEDIAPRPDPASYNFHKDLKAPMPSVGKASRPSAEGGVGSGPKSWTGGGWAVVFWWRWWC